MRSCPYHSVCCRERGHWSEKALEWNWWHGEQEKEIQSCGAERDPGNIITSQGICSSTLDLKHSLSH